MFQLILIVLAFVVLCFILSMFAPLFNSSGEMAAVTKLDPEDAVSNAITGFAANGWDTTTNRPRFAVLQKGPDGCTSLILLVVIFPVGLVYLLTDWGRGRITVRAAEGDDNVTHVLIQWGNTSARGEVQGLVDWLATQSGRRYRH